MDNNVILAVLVGYMKLRQQQMELKLKHALMLVQLETNINNLLKLINHTYVQQIVDNNISIIQMIQHSNVLIHVQVILIQLKRLVHY